MLHSMDVIVQPAVSWMGLNDEIERSGLFFPVDPAPSVSSVHDSLPNRKSSFDLSFPGKNRGYGRHKLQVNVFSLSTLQVQLADGIRSGTNAVRYGTMKDWVINLTVVLADGTIIKTRQRPR